MDDLRVGSSKIYSECIVDLTLKKMGCLIGVGEAQGLSDSLGQDLLQDGTGRRSLVQGMSRHVDC